MMSQISGRDEGQHQTLITSHRSVKDLVLRRYLYPMWEVVVGVIARKQRLVLLWLLKNINCHWRLLSPAVLRYTKPCQKHCFALLKIQTQPPEPPRKHETWRKAS